MPGALFGGCTTGLNQMTKKYFKMWSFSPVFLLQSGSQSVSHTYNKTFSPSMQILVNLCSTKMRVLSFNTNFVKNFVYFTFLENLFFIAQEIFFLRKHRALVGSAHGPNKINQILFFQSYILTHQVLVKTAILAQNKEGNNSFVGKLLGEDYSVTFWLSYLVALVGTGGQEIV